MAKTDLKLHQFYSESRPALVSGYLEVTTPPKAKTSKVNAPTLTKEIKSEKVKLTRAEKDLKIKPMKETLGALSTGIDTHQKQLERKKLLLKWRKVENDIEEIDTTIPLEY